MSLSEWSDKYREVLSNIPQPDSILTALDGEAILTIEATGDKPPFIYGRAYVPEIPDLEIAWHLQGKENPSHLGLKCILMPKARSLVLKNCPIIDNIVMVKSLKVIRASQSNKSLLCEVHEFLSEGESNA